MKTVDHSYEQALIMHDYVNIHVIINIIVTPMTYPQTVDMAIMGITTFYEIKFEHV